MATVMYYTAFNLTITYYWQTICCIDHPALMRLKFLLLYRSSNITSHWNQLENTS